MVKVSLEGTVVAEFERSTYESIVTNYLNATVSSVTFNSSTTGSKSMDVVITVE